MDQRVRIYLCVFLMIGINVQIVQSQVAFSLKAGYYSVKQTLTLSAPDSSKIFFTTNGSEPTTRSNVYIKPLVLDSTVVVRAASYKHGERSEIHTNSYFFGVDSTQFAIVSLSVNPSVLFHPVKGLFAKGPYASDTFPYRGANFYKHIEKPCYVEFFETGHKKVFQGKLGFKVFGGMSRIFPQKSFALHASQKTYGTSKITHQIFPDRSIESFKKIVLRNSGSDFGETHFRDALITSFGADMGLEVQAYRPSIVYINGTYWGIYNLREKLTRHFLEENLGINKDSVDLIEHRRDIKAGTRKHYDWMLSYMRAHDLSNTDNFLKVDSMMDVENFLTYQIMEIYIDNQDAGGNIKFWRPQIKGGKWRWILFDTDFGLGHYGWRGYKNNSLLFHTKPNGPKWPNPPWSTFIIRKLFENQDVQNRFVANFLDNMNFTLDSTQIIERIDRYIQGVELELPRHWARWSLSSKTWQKNVERMKTFARKRPFYMRKHLQSYFSWLGDPYVIRVELDSGGYVLLNQTYKLYTKKELTYMSGSRVDLQAFSYDGYSFLYWDLDGKKRYEVPLTLLEGDSFHCIRPIFRRSIPEISNILINEICFSDSNTGDWIEIYNPTDTTINLSGWSLTDGSNRMYTFDSSTILSDGYVILARNDLLFSSYHKDSIHVEAVLPFGLSRKSDCMLLYDNRGTLIDSVQYEIRKKKRGKCTGISLNDFFKPNHKMKPWKYNHYNHSPGRMNPEHVKLLRKREEKLFKERIKIAAVVSLPFFSLMLGLGFYRSKKKLPINR